MAEPNRYMPESMDDYNRRFARAARNDHDAHRPLTERDCLDDIFTWQEERRVTVVEYEDGGVSIRYRGVPLAARPFHKDGSVTQASIVENKLLSGALTEIRKRQQQREQELVRSAKETDICAWQNHRTQTPGFDIGPRNGPKGLRELTA